MLDKDIIYDIEALEKNYNNFEFGCYLRNIRKAQKISVRQLAKAVNKTATYLSDIENGNNKPPNKDLLEEIIKELHIDDYPKLKNNLFDLAALEKNDIPSAWVASDSLVEASRALAGEYSQLAEQLKIPFADTRSWNVDLTFDGVHFSEEGHHTFAANIVCAVQPWLYTSE